MKIVLFLLLSFFSVKALAEPACMAQARSLVAIKLKESVYAGVSEELSTNGRSKVNCEKIIKEEVSKAVSDEDKLKCKNGQLSDDYFFDKSGLSDISFEPTPDQSECFNKGETDRVTAFKSVHNLLTEKLKGSEVDLIKLCKLAKAKYVEMEKNRRKVISDCSASETPKCQIADANGNCPGSPEAQAFVIKETPEVRVVPGSNNIESRIQRIQSDRKKCEEQRDPYACSRMRSRGAKGIGK